MCRWYSLAEARRGLSFGGSFPVLFAEEAVAGGVVVVAVAGGGVVVVAVAGGGVVVVAVAGGGVVVVAVAGGGVVVVAVADDFAAEKNLWGTFVLCCNKEETRR